MINLLADSHKREIRAGRTNVILVRYIGMLLVALMIVAGILAGSTIVLRTVESNTQNKINENNVRVAAYSKTNLAANEFRGDLSVAKSILDKEVTYSKIINRITDSIPNGIVIDSLDLDATTLGTPRVVNANGKSYRDGLRLKDAFASNTTLYSNVSLASINAGESGEYPFKIVMNVTINKGAAL